MDKRTTELTAEERRWLSGNWSVGDPSFGLWVAGSTQAHKLVRCLLDDYDGRDEELERLREALGNASHESHRQQRNYMFHRHEPDNWRRCPDGECSRRAALLPEAQDG